MPKTPNKSINLIYWLVFAVATYSITQFFGGYRYFQTQGELMGYLINGLWLLMFVLAMFYMTYQIYREEKKTNNLRVSFAPFDALHQWQETRLQERVK